jgi:hypothetical protein
VALILSALVLGFVGGWVLRGDDGTVTVLETGAPATTEAAAPDAPESTTGTAPAPPATTAEAPPPPERSAIALVVLNTTDTAGLAGDTASEAESIGYVGVVAGNAPSGTDPSTVYHAAGQEAAARRVSRDLQIANVAPLPGAGPIVDAARQANPDAIVVVVLGPE